jgi:F1F0 ATPase subunit 2
MDRLALGVAMIAAACALVGVALGVAHVATLGRNIDLFVSGRAMAALALQLVRLATIVAVFFAIARVGVAPLLAAFVAFALSRTVCLRRRR